MKLILFASALTAGLLSATAPAFAATFTVTDTTDAVDIHPGDGVCATAKGRCTLRAAIEEANALAGADTVTLPAGKIELGLQGRDEDAATTGDLDITDDLFISGAGAALTVVNANRIDRAFEVRTGANGVESARSNRRPTSWEPGRRAFACSCWRPRPPPSQGFASGGERSR